MVAGGLWGVSICVASECTRGKFVAINAYDTHVEVAAVDCPTVTVIPIPACLGDGLCWAGMCAQGAIGGGGWVLNLAPLRNG